jgi:hypothetical protein
VCILETQLLGLLYGSGASFVQKWSMPWMSANIQVPFLYSLISMHVARYVHTQLWTDTAYLNKILLSVPLFIGEHR